MHHRRETGSQKSVCRMTNFLRAQYCVRVNGMNTTSPTGATVVPGQSSWTRVLRGGFKVSAAFQDGTTDSSIGLVRDGLLDRWSE